jgi:hypothetical protein
MRKVMLSAWVLFTCLCVAKTVVACECLNASPNAFTELQGRDAVFVGKVVEVREVEIPYKNEANRFTVELEVNFLVEKYFKGALGSTVTVRTNTGCCSCGSEFESGKKYLVYANGDKRMLSTNSCTRTKLLKYAQKDLQEIERGRKEQKSMHTKPPSLVSRSVTSAWNGLAMSGLLW